MVYEINRMEVPEEEVLSDSIYYFRADTKTVELVSEEWAQRAV